MIILLANSNRGSLFMHCHGEWLSQAFLKPKSQSLTSQGVTLQQISAGQSTLHALIVWICLQCRAVKCIFTFQTFNCIFKSFPTDKDLPPLSFIHSFILHQINKVTYNQLNHTKVCFLSCSKVKKIGYFLRMNKNFLFQMLQNSQ